MSSRNYGWGEHKPSSMYTNNGLKQRQEVSLMAYSSASNALSCTTHVAQILMALRPTTNYTQVAHACLGSAGIGVATFGQG